MSFILTQLLSATDSNDTYFENLEKLKKLEEHVQLPYAVPVKMRGSNPAEITPLKDLPTPNVSLTTGGKAHHAFAFDNQDDYYYFKIGEQEYILYKSQ